MKEKRKAKRGRAFKNIYAISSVMDNETIQKLQETLAYQEQQISDLNEVVLTQGRDIDMLKSLIFHLRDKVTAMKEEAESVENDSGLSVTERAGRDKPPHY